MIEKDQETLPFPTTANKPKQPVVDTSLEGLRKLVEKGAPQVLQLVNKNRRDGAEQLRLQVDRLTTDLELVEVWRNKVLEPLMIVKDGDKVVFSLENTLINMRKALDALSSFADSQNSLMDMLINDLVGMVQNANAMQSAIMVSNGQCQTLIQLLIDKGQVTEEEMKATWASLVESRKEQMKREVPPVQDDLTRVK